MNKFYITLLLIFVSVCLFIAVSKSFASTSQIGKTIDKIGVQSKVGENSIFIFNVKYSHSLIMKFCHVNSIGNVASNDL